MTPRRSGDVAEMTGVASPYQEPLHPELVLRTGERSVEACVAAVLELVRGPA